MFRSHKVSTVSGYNYVLPCSIRNAVPVKINVVIADSTDPLCQQYSKTMSTIQNSLLSYLVDLLAAKSSPQDAVSNLTALEQNLMLNCAAIAKNNTKAACC